MIFCFLSSRWGLVLLGLLFSLFYVIREFDTEDESYTEGEPFIVHIAYVQRKAAWFCTVEPWERFSSNLTVECISKELKQPRRRRQPKPHKFAYLTMKNSFCARFARAFFIFSYFENVLVLSTTWNDLFWSCVDDVSIWWHVFKFVFLCPKSWF